MTHPDTTPPHDDEGIPADESAWGHRERQRQEEEEQQNEQDKLRDQTAPARKALEAKNAERKARAKEEERKKAEDSAKRKKRKQRRKISKADVQHLMRAARRLDPDTGKTTLEVTPGLHTYKSAELELQRIGYLEIIESHLWLERSASGKYLIHNLDSQCSSIGIEHIKQNPSTLAIWKAPAYYADDTLRVYPVPPPPGTLASSDELEAKLDQNWHEIVNRSECEVSVLPASYASPIDQLVRIMRIDFQASGELGFPLSTEDFNRDDFHYDPEQKLLRDSFRPQVIERLREWGLLDCDTDYGDPDFLYLPVGCGLPDSTEGLRLLTQGKRTYEDDPQSLHPDDPRRIWRDFRELHIDDVQALRESIQELVYLSFLAGREDKGNELHHKLFSLIQEGQRFSTSRLKAGNTYKTHTGHLKDATDKYVKSANNGDRYFLPTAAKVRDYILASKNKKWIKALKAGGKGSLKGVVQRYREKTNRDKSADAWTRELTE
ncbi:MAG: hypothetical protein H7A51_01475 [Akkermansiaceae bacterium]|nr:hypothetical protein [Akkermansiaceae bacterium]